LVIAGERATIRSWLSESTHPRGSRDINYKEIEANVPIAIAHELEEAWVNALMETRYPSFAPAGVDGDNYYFAAWVAPTGLYLQGYTWSQRADGPPKWLAVLGDKISEHVRSGDGDAKKLETDIVATRNRIYSFYQLHADR
jgi:hypothetical protein